MLNQCVLVFYSTRCLEVCTGKNQSNNRCHSCCGYCWHS